MYLTEIPGYKRACERAERIESYRRDFAFLGITETLRFFGGRSIEVRQLTLRMYIQLCAVRSPFMVGGMIGPEHVAQILWRISPEYDLRLENTDARAKFVESIADIPYKSSVRAINRYIDRQLMDRPPAPVKRNDTRPDTSFAASLIHALSSGYGWSGEEILDLPLARLFQYLRRIQRSNDPDMGFWNPIRDRLARKITSKYLRKAGAQENADAS